MADPAPAGAWADDAGAAEALGLDPRALSPDQTLAVHVTGYYEPEIDGSPVRTDDHPVPVHALPPMGIGASRAEIDADDLLRGYEIAWLRDPVDRFFLQVQGSGRIRFPNGGVLRVTYAGRNGHPYTSVGRLLVERGVFAPAAVSAAAVADWLRADPARGRDAMAENASYVMFRPLHGIPPGAGPPGTAGVPLTPMRSVAVDPGTIPLGTAAWLEVDGSDGPVRTLCAAQDTGSAITGARVDLFFGTGAAAGARAGRLNHPGRLTLLR